ncbi:MAG TPA: ATP-binding cassette domain-containing protein [Acidimicrobiales bacterium]|nr:ATP-binding cassette domain-containing protein [Acidimicrobiales bacterium]
MKPLGQSSDRAGCPKPEGGPGVEIHRLTKRFGSVLAVDDLSFLVPRGTVTGFLGPNGAGKTTTLRMLLGLVEATSGFATIDGHRYRELAAPLRHVGAVLEASNFYPGRTARNHLRVQAAAGGLESDRVEIVLDLVGLEAAADRRVGGFSLGMRQRLGLAGALLGDPDVLILDEPANGLDPEGVRWLRLLLRSLADDGRTVLVSSHILAEVAQTVDDVVIIDRGRMVAHASLDQLAAAAGAPVVRIRTPKVEQLCAAIVADGGEARVVGPEVVEVTATTAERVGHLAAEGAIPIFESVTQFPNLEDVFFQLTATAGSRGTR